jgi:hypothetical protein
MGGLRFEQNWRYLAATEGLSLDELNGHATDESSALHDAAVYRLLPGVQEALIKEALG